MVDQWDSEKIYDDQGNFVFVGELSPEDRKRVTRSSFGTFLVSTDEANAADRLAHPEYYAEDFAECIDCGRPGCKGQCQ